MKYVFDSGPFIDCRYYYQNIFKSYWNKLNQLAERRDIISVKEVYNEILKGVTLYQNGLIRILLYLNPLPLMNLRL